MKLTAALFSLASLLPSALALAGTLAYDTIYDSPSTSTLSLACSDGVNGLYTKGYQSLGSIGNFPNVGAAPSITGWNSPNCGKCFKVTYNGKSIFVTGVDSSRGSGGFVVSKAAMNTLTNGQADMLGRVNVDWEQLSSGASCNMP
ncbi:SnodProt1 [Kalaharituber pfeilii]|nr:SnodProt1 [Kalaharituber pfeilii]